MVVRRYTALEKSTTLPLAKRVELLRQVIRHKVVDRKADIGRRGEFIRNERTVIISQTGTHFARMEKTKERKKAKSRRRIRADGSPGAPRTDLKIEVDYGFYFKQRNHHDRFHGMLKTYWKGLNRIGLPTEEVYTHVFHEILIPSFYAEYGCVEADLPYPPRRL